MNQKILALTMAAALVVPMMAHADVKLSGTIQAETGSAKLGMAKDRLRLTGDDEGVLLNGGPNRLRFDIDEKLSNGWSAMARYQVAFNTSVNKGLTNGQESWIGLKMNSEAFYFRFGNLYGNYKALKNGIDPFVDTSLQARGTSGGMSGSKHLVSCTAANTGLCQNYQKDGDLTNVPSTIGDLGARKVLGGFTNNGYVNNALELGTKMGGFSASLQGVWDQTDVLNGGGLIALEYTHDNFSVFAGAAYTDLDDSVGSVSTSKLDSGGNWKVGGTATFAGMKLGLQYEHAEIGTLTDSSFAKVKNGVTTIAPIAGTYLLGSIDFRADNLAIGGWVAKYSEDKDEVKLSSTGLNQKGEYNNDALSFAVGLKYFLSKRTLAFGGYQQTNSENNIYDQKVVGVGVRHSF